MLDSLLGRGDVPKCKALIEVIKSRVDFLRKKRRAKADMLRRDVTDLLMRGQHQDAFFRVELLLKEENVLTGYDMIEIFCDCILKQPRSIQRKKDCPEVIKEAVSSLIFAAARCAEIPELQSLRGIFATRYGDEFAISAVDLHPDCGVSQKTEEKFSVNAPSNDAKLKLMKEIADKAGLQWDDSNLQAKFCSSKESEDTSGSKCLKTVIAVRMEDSRSIGFEADTYERDIPVVSSSLREVPVIPDIIGNTYHVKKTKSFSSSRTNADKSFSSLSDSNGQANIRFVDPDADSAANPVDLRNLAADGEKNSNKKWIKAKMVDCPFDTALESKEDHGRTRQAGNKSRENKNSCQTNAYKHKDLKMQYSNVNTSFPEESRGLQTKYTNGHANTSFLEQSKRVPERDFRLRAAAPLKSDVAYKTKFSDGPIELGENGVQDGSHGRRRNRLSRCTEQDAEYVEVGKFTRPFGVLDTDAAQECKSEFQVSSTNGNKVGSKSIKQHSRSSWYDTEKGNTYDHSCSFSVTNGSDYTAVEPSVRKSMGRKMYDEGFQESSTLNSSSLNFPDKEEQTCQIIGDKVKNGVHTQMHSSHKRHDYCNELDSGDGTFIEVDNTSSARHGPSPVHERISSRESGRREYYASEAATHEEVKHSYRREADKGSKYLNTRSHGVTNNASQTGHEEEHEMYYSVKEAFYENTESNSNSFHRVPYESQKHREKGERTGRSLYTPNDMSSKNIYHVDDHASGSEAHLKQPESRKEYTRSTHPQNVESTKRSHASLWPQDGKPRVGGKNYLDSPHADVYDSHQNSDLQDQHFKDSQSLGPYINETDMAGGKSQRSRLDGRHGSSKLLECRKGYPFMEEPFASSLEDVHQSDESSLKITRFDRLQSENNEKVDTPRNSNMRIVEKGVTQQTEQRDGIAEAKDCSAGKGRRQDIQHPESRRSRNTRRAHHIQSDSLQTECLELASVKKVLKPTQSLSSINSQLPPLPPTCTLPKSSCFSPEHSSQHRPSSSTVPGNGSPQRPLPEPYRSVSLPPKSPVRSASLQSKLLKSSSDVGIPNTAHVHPKLPDYDDLAARFAALKQQRQSSNTSE